MSALSLLNHLLNFVAPAFVLVLLLAVCGRLMGPASGIAMSLWKQMAVNFVAGVVVLSAGLAAFGSDGAMATYGALVVVCGVGQWLLVGGWRR